MNLDSARELKALLVKRHPLIAKLGVASAFSLSAQSTDRVDPIRQTIALGISRKNEQGYRLAVRIQNRALESSPQVEEITKRARGDVDVQYIGRLVKRARPWNQSRQRPLLIGVSIAHFRVTAGTLGCFVKTRQGGAVRILSNNHVLANENRSKKGDAVLLPGPFDGGRKGKDTVGTLDKYVRLKRTGLNFVDAALATVRDGIDFDAVTLRGLGNLGGSGFSMGKDRVPRSGSRWPS